MNLSFQKLFFAIATVFALFAILMLARLILIPLSIALIISFILLPVAKKFESWGMSKIIAAFFSIFLVFLIIGGFIFFFSTQIIELSKEFSHFQNKIIRTFADITLYINKNVQFIKDLKKNELFEMIKDWLNESTSSIVTKSINDTATFLTGLAATTIYTFLILIYRNGLTQAFIAFFPKEENERVLKMFKSVQQVGKKYLLGMIIVVFMIGLANSIGLWIIGIDNPFLFGFLGAALSIIPYVGTVLGAIIPLMYAFVSYDSPWMAIQVALLFWAVQLISDNLLNPKIVGGNLNINALAAILSLIIGAVTWGVAGMILFLPFTAMLKVVCEEYEELKPIALLIGNDNYQEKDASDIFVTTWAKKVRRWFSRSNSSSKKKHKEKAAE